jgi:Na+-transporting NADH:ubiquinone oxidoreductase subunit B
MEMFIGTIPGSVGETSTLAILIGAMILIITGIGSWKIIVSVFAGGLGMGLLLNAFEANAYMEIPAYYHFVMGGFAFGAVFMATDPVSGSQTERGKWIYGFLIGIMSVLIRVLNPAYPEGVMLAILIMNLFAPLIDYFVIQSSINKRLKRAKISTNNLAR